MRLQQASIPSPVRAETITEPGWAASSRRASSAASSSQRPTASALLTTSSSGRPSAPISASTVRTASIWPSKSGAEPSTTWTMQVGLAHHLEGGAEGLDHLVGQLAHEADRVGEQHRLPAGQVELAGPGVEGGEEPVLDQDVRRRTAG